MKEWICREISTTTKDVENGILMRETELIRCKDCEHYDSEHEVCCVYLSYRLAKDADDYCSDAERKE